MKEKIINVPNAITFLRLLLVIPILLSIYHDSKLIYLFIVLALLTELDGTVAKKLNQTTHFGANFDPLVDAVVIFSSLIMFTIKGVLLPLYLITFMVIEIIKTKKLLVISRKQKKLILHSITNLGKAGFASMAALIILMVIKVPYLNLFIWITIAIGLMSMIQTLIRKK
ncbi:CDP-alcohol phosphatidyltransferase family protein [Nanoarchaeota archaeon]